MSFHSATTVSLGGGDDSLFVGDFYGLDFDAAMGDGDDTVSVGTNFVPYGGGLLVDAGPGDDRITGSRGDDVILGRAGDDVLDGYQGEDRVNGGAGRDTCTAETVLHCEQ